MPRFDTSIYKNPLRSVADYEAELDQRDLSRQNLMLNKLKLDEHQRDIQKQNELQGLYRGLGADPDANYQTLLNRVGPDAALKYRKGIDDSVKERAAAEKAGLEAKLMRLTMVGNVMSRVEQDPSQAMSAIELLENEKIIDFNKSSQLRKLATTASPEQIRQFAQQQIALAQKDAKDLLPKLGHVDAGGTIPFTATDPISGKPTTTGSITKTMSPSDEQQAKDAAAGRAVQWARLAEDKRQAGVKETRETKDDADPGKYTQVIVDPDRGPLLVDRKTGKFSEVTSAAGERVSGKNVTAAKKLESQLQIGIEEARKLIPIATGSGVGRAVDAATSFVGYSTEGDDASTQLETLAGWMTSNVPRMQGPQSDKDTLLYKQMAAQVGDRTKTRAARLKALDTLEGLQKKYSEMAGSPVKPQEGAYSDAEKERRYQEWKARQQ